VRIFRTLGVRAGGEPHGRQRRGKQYDCSDSHDIISCLLHRDDINVSLLRQLRKTDTKKGAA